MQQRVWWRWVGLAVRVLVSGAFLLAIFWVADPAAIWAVWRGADLRLIGLALLTQGGALALSARRWQLLLHAQGERQPYGWLFGTTLVGQFANNFLPTMVGGDAVRIAQLGRRIASYSRAGTSVFLDRLFGFLALSLIVTVALLGTGLSPAAEAPQTSVALRLLTVGFALVAVGITAGALAAPWLLPRLGPWLPRLRGVRLLRLSLPSRRHERNGRRCSQRWPWASPFS